MKKGKSIASVIIVGLLVASLGTTCFAQETAEDQKDTKISEQQDGTQLKRSKRTSEDQSDSNKTGENDSQKEKRKDKKKNGKHSSGARIAESIAALEDGEAKSKAQAAYNAFEEARKNLDEALKAAGIETTRSKDKQKVSSEDGSSAGTKTTETTK